MLKGRKIEKKTADTFAIKYPEVDKSVLVWIHKNMKTHEECNVDDHFFGDLSVCISRSTACESVCESVIMAEYDPWGTSRQEHLNMFLSTLAGVRVFVCMEVDRFVTGYAKFTRRVSSKWRPNSAHGYRVLILSRNSLVINWVLTG